TGEEGIGKSALVEALTAETSRAGALVVEVACFEAERSLYLQPLVDVVRDLVRRTAVDEVRQLVPELTDILGPVAYEHAGPEVEHRRSLDAIGEFLTHVGEHRPVLIVIEDMQHAGESTVEALHMLAAHWQG